MKNINAAKAHGWRTVLVRLGGRARVRVRERARVRVRVRVRVGLGVRVKARGRRTVMVGRP